MTTFPTPPHLTPLEEVAASLGIPPRRLRERAWARQFAHVRIGKERYLTDKQLVDFIDTFTVGQDMPKSDRDKAIEQTRERLARQGSRGRYRSVT
ncbi:hypothetical protein [Salinispora arenicola]|uniref:hypothetical protein n=1 Tax=Salinispora arenicola TaxID=168697 RepID=UPI0004B87029|nr:hypothetical protein [Salinispora arenicola]